MTPMALRMVAEAIRRAGLSDWPARQDPVQDSLVIVRDPFGAGVHFHIWSDFTIHGQDRLDELVRHRLAAAIAAAPAGFAFRLAAHRALQTVIA